MGESPGGKSLCFMSASRNKIDKKKAKVKTMKQKTTKQKQEQKVEKIRGPNLEIFIQSRPGVTMEDALTIADAEKRVIASNLSLDRVFVGSDRWAVIEGALICWTGTMVAYEETGKRFGKTVEYVDEKTKIRYVFEVPDQYLGEKNAILVSEHPDYRLEIDGNNRIVRAAVVDLIEQFPAEANKWYVADPKHGIPFGDSVDGSDPNARYLWRIEKKVGLSIRGYFYFTFGNVNHNINIFIALAELPSSAFGVAVECPVSSDQFPVTKVK